MSLKTKFNLAMLAAFLVGLSLAAVLPPSHRERRGAPGGAPGGVHHDERRLGECAPIRSRRSQPLLAEQSKLRFLPHTVPSWAAQTNMRTQLKQLPSYTYKEASLNPTNPADRATDWEADIIGEFTRNPGAERVCEHAGFRAGADPVALQTDPAQRPGLPDLSLDTRGRAGHDDRPVRVGQRVRVEAERRRRRTGRHGAAAGRARPGQQHAQAHSGRIGRWSSWWSSCCSTSC